MTTTLEPTTEPKLSLGERWKRHWYLQSVELWLDPMPGKRRRQILRELRAILAMASAESGMAAAIADLGKPRHLAREYLDAEPQNRPTWSHGVAATLLAFTIWLWILGIYTVGALSALRPTGVTDGVETRFLGLTITVEAHGHAFGATFSGFSWISLIAFVVVFLLASRSWRLLRKAER